jgi:hypothetical protein
MARRGRPRKVGERYASGDLKRGTTLAQMAAVEMARLNREKLVVLSQPHRRGEGSQLAESPLGRLILTTGLREECFEAATTYAATKRKYLTSWGARFLTTIRGSGNDTVMETIHRWRDETTAAESAMARAAGDKAAGLVDNLALHEIDATPRDVERLKRALLALAVHQGRLPHSVLE